MNFETIWEQRYKACVWLMPVVIAAFVMHFVLLPIAEKTADVNNKIAAGASNVYEEHWLDSVRLELSEDVEELQADLRAIQPHSLKMVSVQLEKDKLLKLFSSCGLNVKGIKHQISGQHQTAKTTITLTGDSQFYEIYNLFKKLNEEHPYFLLNRLTIRKLRNNYSFLISLSVFGQNKEAKKNVDYVIKKG
ncbi:MAG: hypothetical protein HQK83_15620 [Fibrobacteria bacterium]|nr:hypothetical protein [Fibrobacteria bacterium]